MFKKLVPVLIFTSSFCVHAQMKKTRVGNTSIVQTQYEMRNENGKWVMYDPTPITAEEDLEKSSCHDSRLKLLKQIDPNGYTVYKELRHKDVFIFFNECDKDEARGLDTAVHESTHVVDSQRSHLGKPVSDERSYRLIGGEDLTIQKGSTFPRSQVTEILPDEIKSSHYTALYLSGSMGTQDFSSLLEEFNAYANGNRTMNAVAKNFAEKNPNLNSRSKEGYSIRPRFIFNGGTMYMMFYIGAYLKIAKVSEPSTWAVLNNSQNGFKNAVLKLWNQAEQEILNACNNSMMSFFLEPIESIYTTDLLDSYFAFLGSEFQPRKSEVLNCFKNAHKEERIWSNLYDKRQMAAFFSNVKDGEAPRTPAPQQNKQPEVVIKIDESNIEKYEQEFATPPHAKPKRKRVEVTEETSEKSDFIGDELEKYEYVPKD